MRKEVDYIIVGQGVAGTLLHYFLEQKGKTVAVIDNHHQTAASKVAAGIINPITGRRYVKTWLAEELIPFAAQTYRALEQKLDFSFYHQIPLVRTLSNRSEERFWDDRLLNEYYEQYMKEEADLGNYKAFVSSEYQYAEIKQSAQAELGKLVETYRKQLEAKGEFLSEAFDYQLIKFEDNSIVYKHLQAKKLIFCEGNAAQKNLFFNYLPFGGTKGEALIVKIPNTNFNRILKQRIFIVPLQDDHYWIGATNDKKDQTEAPTAEGKKYLVDYLEKVLNLPFEIIEHKAAIRPTVKDRRPFLGLHPRYEQFAIFNGLGTKGASLAPYFAHHLTNFLTEGKDLMPEVDIKRYEALTVDNSLK
ncbi:MAG: FAD-binding oxidoreductase [Bacteroidota bacterium]